MTEIEIGKFRLPLGTIVVDAVLVFTLIAWGTTMTNKLDEIQGRIAKLELVRITPEAERRLSVVETREMEIFRRLEKIEGQNEEILRELRRR